MTQDTKILTQGMVKVSLTKLSCREKRRKRRREGRGETRPQRVLVKGLFHEYEYEH